MEWFQGYYGVFIGIAVLMVIWILFAGLVRATFFTVRQETAALVERFGRFVRVARPGLRLRIPFIERVARRISMQVQVRKVEVESKSKDDVFVTLPLIVQFRVTQGREADAFYLSAEPAAILDAIVSDVVRAIAPTMLLDEIFTSREDLVREVTNRVQESMIKFGYDVLSVQLIDVYPDKRVAEAMNRINAAQRLEIAAKAEAQALKTKKLAEAEAEAERLRLFGEGVAKQQECIVAGLRHLMPGLTDEELLTYVKQANHIAMLKEMGGSSRVIIVPSGNGDGSELLGNLRNAIITGVEAQGSSGETSANGGSAGKLPG